MLNLLFVLSTVLPLPFWILMIFFPRSTATRRVAHDYNIFLVLGAIYVFLLVGASIAFFSTLGKSVVTVPQGTAIIGWLDLQASPIIWPVALLVWVHMVIMDLIGGHWIYHEAHRIGAPLLVASGCIFLALLFGPIGLFTFILWRNLTLARRNAINRAGGEAAPAVPAAS